MKGTIISHLFFMACAVERSGVVLDLMGIEDPRKRRVFELVAGTHPNLATEFFSAFVEVWRDPEGRPEEFDILAGLFGSIGRPGYHYLSCATVSEEEHVTFFLRITKRSDTFVKHLMTLSAPKNLILLDSDKIPTAHPWKLHIGSAWNGTWVLE